MNRQYKISIPKPCHEDWQKMTPKEKGRFCSSCAKTVIDFTKKTTQEIQDILIENKNQRVCGHFYKKQLDTISIEIPQATFQQQLSFQKIFILTLFFVMGTTLFSCQYENGKKQKIDQIILVDSIKNIEKTIDSFAIKKDTIVAPKPFIKVPPPPQVTGIMICPTPLDSIKTPKNIDVVEGEIEFHATGKPAKENKIDDLLVGKVIAQEVEDITLFGVVEMTPKFKSSKKTGIAARKEFNDKMHGFVKENFKVPQVELGLKEGKHRIYTQFIIDKKGNITNIKIRAPHPALKKEVYQLLKKLPQFIPAQQADKKINVRYTLPIAFIIE